MIKGKNLNFDDIINIENLVKSEGVPLLDLFKRKFYRSTGEQSIRDILNIAKYYDSFKTLTRSGIGAVPSEYSWVGLDIRKSDFIHIARRNRNLNELWEYRGHRELNLNLFSKDRDAIYKMEAFYTMVPPNPNLVLICYDLEGDEYRAEIDLSQVETLFCFDPYSLECIIHAI